jgi:hypothetical protein
MLAMVTDSDDVLEQSFDEEISAVIAADINRLAMCKT